MNETYIRDRLRDTLKAYGYRVDVQTDTVVCYKCHTKIVPPRGKPDMTILNPHTEKGYYIEVKTIRRDDTSFPFSRIEDHQRRILTAGGKCSYLALGEITQNEGSSRDRLTNIWLLHWSMWRAIEEQYQSFYSRKSIPRSDVRAILATQSMRKKPGLCYPSPFNGNSTWLLSIYHPIFPWRTT